MKVKAYQNNHTPYKKLIRLKKLNTICDKKAKDLIINEWREKIAFPFQLSLPYVVAGDQILNFIQ